MAWQLLDIWSRLNPCSSSDRRRCPPHHFNICRMPGSRPIKSADAICTSVFLAILMVSGGACRQHLNSACVEVGSAKGGVTCRSVLTSTPRSVMMLLCTVRTTSSSISANDFGATHRACFPLDSCKSIAVYFSTYTSSKWHPRIQPGRCNLNSHHSTFTSSLLLPASPQTSGSKKTLRFLAINKIKISRLSTCQGMTLQLVLKE